MRLHEIVRITEALNLHSLHADPSSLAKHAEFQKHFGGKVRWAAWGVGRQWFFYEGAADLITIFSNSKIIDPEFDYVSDLGVFGSSRYTMADIRKLINIDTPGYNNQGDTTKPNFLAALSKMRSPIIVEFDNEDHESPIIAVEADMNLVVAALKFLNLKPEY